MKYSAIFRVALRSLRRAPVRSSLTALGVIVGVAAMVATTSIGNGAKTAIKTALASPESRTFFLIASVPPSQKLVGSQLPAAYRLQVEDYLAIRDQVANTSVVSPRIYVASARAQANGITAQVAIDGLDVHGFTTVRRDLRDGEVFSTRDVRRAARVCLISQSLASLLNSRGYLPAESIRIDAITFAVIGVVADAPIVASAINFTDLHVYMPYTTLLQRIGPGAQFSITVQARRVEDVGSVQQEVDNLMEGRRNGRKADFITRNALEAIRAYAAGSIAVARLVAAIGAVALVVGGIGIMNIMLVSVTERTREIGLRLAIGTRRSGILCQFLVEAVMLSLLGGILGILIGCIASWMITRANEWPTEITAGAVIMAFCVSGGIGLVFGWYPARRAAKLQPMHALRSE